MAAITAAAAANQRMALAPCYASRTCTSIGRTLEPDPAVGLPALDDLASVQAVEKQELTTVGTVEKATIRRLSGSTRWRPPIGVIKELRLNLLAPGRPTKLGRDPAEWISIVSVNTDFYRRVIQKLQDLLSAEINSNQRPDEWPGPPRSARTESPTWWQPLARRQPVGPKIMAVGPYLLTGSCTIESAALLLCACTMCVLIVGRRQRS